MATIEDLEMWIDDMNGHIFHISGGDLEGAEGVALAYDDLGTTFEDMYESPITAIYNSTAFEIGGRFGGIREDMFEFALAFNVQSTPNLPWRVAESRFRKCLQFTQDARIYCKINGVSTRYLTVRLMESPKLKVKSDPNKQKYGLVLIKFVGPFPRWCEDDYTNSWVCATDTTTPPTVAAPTGLTLATSQPVLPSTIGETVYIGQIEPGAYYYKLTSVGADGESTASAEAHITVTQPNSIITLNWTPAAGADSIRIYRGNTAGSETLMNGVGIVSTANDIGDLTPNGVTSPPTSNTSQKSEIGSVTIYNPTNCEQWVRFVAQAGNAGIIWTLPDYSWGDDRFNRGNDDLSRMIIMPALINGENIVVDTDEFTIAGQVVSSIDTAVYLRMNGVQFLYPVPPYTPPTVVPVAVTEAQIGNGVQVRCPLSWSRPWGLE